MQLYNENCFSANLKVEDNSIDLFLCDPPFGIGESEFDRHYKRSSKTITNNYCEAPKDYEDWMYQWLSIAKQKMKDNATMYLFSGWSNLKEVLNAIYKCNFNIINHLI